MYKLQLDEMTEVNEMMSRLNKLTFNKKDGYQFESVEGFTFAWEFSLGCRIMPVQLVISVYHEGYRITHWGCVGKEDTTAFVEFILKTESKIREIKYDLREEKSKKGLDLFNSL